MSASQDATLRAPRRWLQFRLRTLLLLPAVFGMSLCFERVHRQKSGVQSVRELGGVVRYDYQESPLSGVSGDQLATPVPAWLLSLFGEDLFFNVVEVHLLSGGPYEERRLTAAVTNGTLAQLKAFPELRSLHLQSTHLTDDGLRRLGAMKRLQVLALHDAAKITDAGISHLASLKSLEEVYINRAQIGDDALRVLSELPLLHTLHAEGVRFTDNGLKFLEGKSDLRVLTILGGRHAFSDAALPHLSKLTRLEQLGLRPTRVTSAGLKHLSRLTNLESLYLSGTNADVSDLARSLPRCKFLR